MHVSWLLRAVHVKFEWLKDHGLLRAKLLGLKTIMKKHIGDWGPQPQAGAEKRPAESAAAPEAESAAEVPAEKADAKPEAAKEEHSSVNAENQAAPEEKKAGSAPKTEDKTKETQTEDAEEKAEETVSEPEEELPKLLAFEQKLDGILTKVDEFQGYWYDEKNRKTLRLIKKQLKRIGKHLKPTRLQLEGEIGFDDPGKTGRIIGTVYSLYPVYKDHIRIDGNYEEKVMRFRGEIRFRIRLGLFISVGLRLLLDRNLRKLIKKLMKKDKQEDTQKTKEEPVETADQEQKAA